MDKIAMYKEEIYKIAKYQDLRPTEQFKKDELDRVTSHAFSYFPREVKKQYKDQVKGALGDSDEFRDHVQHEWVRRARARTKHPHGGKALLGMISAGALLGGITSAPSGSLTNIFKNKGSLESLKALMNKGVPSGATAGLFFGDHKRRKLDEELREKMFGPKPGINSFKDAKDLALAEIRRISGME